MTRFSDLDEHSFEGAVVIVDVDGTLLADSGQEIDEPTLLKLKSFAKTSDVYLCSNGPDKKRVKDFATIAGLTFLETDLKKPDVGIMALIPHANRRVVVIGDKEYTDGRFARNIKADFVLVARIRHSDDAFKIILLYRADDIYRWGRNLLARVRAVAALLRVRQWTKNVLVFAPLFFAQEALSVTHTDQALAAFVLFCFAASSVYILNDFFDCESDRLHPIKRFRPLASGEISLVSASVLFALLLIIIGGLLALLPALILPIGGYIALNILYSKWLKHVAIVDILCISIFYLLRIAAGGAATGIYISPWIILCVFFGALFLIVGKRRAEARRSIRRRVIELYSTLALDHLLAGSAILVIISYGLYSVIGSKSPLAVYSTFFVVCAIFRLLNTIYTEHDERAEYPETLLFKDPWALGAFIAWGIYMFVILYFV